MIAGFLKAYNLPLDYVLYEMSYVNMVMYSAVIPSYDPKRDKETGNAEKQDILKADDPRNTDKVMQLLENAI